jgi:NAD(P)H-dependent FMN reductase
MMTRPLSIPVVLGTSRKGRLSAHVARVFVDLLNRRAGIKSELIDIAQLRLSVDDAGEAIKDEGFAAAMNTADGLVIVAPEYNHSFPGLLKHVLDSCLQEYVHKAVGLVGVSSGPFAGTRVVQSLLPVMRELGLVTIFWDGNISQVGKMFDDSGHLLDDAIVRRSDKFIRELIWMAKCLRYGREQITTDEEAAYVTESMPCPSCGDPMNHHADKALLDSSPEGSATPSTHAVLACAACGMTTARPEPSLDAIAVGASQGL